MSTRYVIGTIFLTELLFAYFLWRLKIPNFLIFSFFGINLISRSVILFIGLPRYFDYSLVIIPYIVLIGLVFLGRFGIRFKPRLFLLVVIGVSIFVFSPLVVEANRVGWVPWWSDVVSYVYELPASKIFLIEDHESGGNLWVRTYPVYGKDFQHTIVIGTQDNLIKEIIEVGHEPPEYVAKLCKRFLDCTSNLNEFENDLKPYDYERVASDIGAILLKRSG